jgi:hypothetical protein
LDSSSDSNARDLHPFYFDASSEEMKKRALLIGGGSEPRVTTTFDNCQFLNNSLTTDSIPGVSQNGVLAVISSFADVTLNNCLFKDNNFDYSSDGTVRYTND